MSVFCITFSVNTHSQKLHYRWTQRAFMLANSSIMLVKSIKLRVFFSILSSVKLFNLLWLIDARRYVKINFSLLNDLSQDAIETERERERERESVTSALEFSN